MLRYRILMEGNDDGDCSINTLNTIINWENDTGELIDLIVKSLDDDKAEDIITMDLRGKTSFADAMIIADGRSNRHVGSMADKLAKNLREYGVGSVMMEGLESCDWVLVDAGDVIVHLFKPTIREIYNLEKMWAVAQPNS
jgi:ribosome-associated protein